MSDSTIALGVAIEALRMELMGSMLAGHGVGLQFEIEPIEMTLQVALSAERGGKASWKILELGATNNSTTTQTLKLRLNPVYKREDGSMVRDYTISELTTCGDSVGPDAD